MNRPYKKNTELIVDFKISTTKFRPLDIVGGLDLIDHTAIKKRVKWNHFN